MPAQSHHLAKFRDLMEDLEELVEEASQDRCRDGAEVSVLEDTIHTVSGSIVKELHNVTASVTPAQLLEANRTLAATKKQALKNVGVQRLRVRRARAQASIPELVRLGKQLATKVDNSHSLSQEGEEDLCIAIEVFTEDVDKLAELTSPGEDLVALYRDLKAAAKKIRSEKDGGGKKRRQSGGFDSDGEEIAYTSRDFSSFAKIIAKAVSSGKKPHSKCTCLNGLLNKQLDS